MRADAERDEGTYRSQFETRISNGGLTAFPGGDRGRWEAGMFGGAYQAAGVHDRERPKYGGLNVLHHRNGACPGFGSCHGAVRLDVDVEALVVDPAFVDTPTGALLLAAATGATARRACHRAIRRRGAARRGEHRRGRRVRGAAIGAMAGLG